MANNYDYAYETSKDGRGEDNGGFVAAKDHKKSTSIPVSTKSDAEKQGSKSRVTRCNCCLLVIIFIICIIGVVIFVLLFTSVGDKVVQKVCGDGSQLSNSTKGDGIDECPGDISIDIPSASSSSVNVSWEEPSVDDSIDSNGILSKSHNPGSSFPVNSVTTVTYVFNDDVRSSCSFDIEINIEITESCPCEPEIIVANCPDNFVHEEPSYCGTVPVTWVEPTATAKCGGDVTVEKSHQPGTDFSAGATSVSYVFTDSSQNQKRCEFNVSVSSIGLEDDTVPPRFFECPEHIYKVLEPGQTTKNIWWDPPTASDGSGLPVTVQQTHSPGDVFSVGGHELVIYTFTDAVGNEAVCEFAVTLYQNGATPDTVPPVISGCPSRTSRTQYVSIPAGDTSGDYNVVWPSATDNDGQVPRVIATHQQGINSLPLGRHVVIISFYDASGNIARCYLIAIVRYSGASPTQPAIKTCPNNVYREIPVGTSTRVCWEEPVLTDGTGTTKVPVASLTKKYNPGAEFFINGCGEQIVSYIFHDNYGTEKRCDFTVTIRAIDHENLPGEWTQWYDPDNPSGYCDCDLRDGMNIVLPPCTTGEPIDAECQTTTGLDWKETGQVAYCCPRLGFVCVNNLNLIYGQRCMDYRVRFKCPPTMPT